jgi:hypothetical protein
MKVKPQKWRVQNAASSMMILTGYHFGIAPLAGIAYTQTVPLKTARKYAGCAGVKLKGRQSMKITTDIDCEIKTCGKCRYLIRNLPVSSLAFSIPITPTCFFFGKKIHKKNGEMWRLMDCIASTIKSNKGV